MFFSAMIKPLSGFIMAEATVHRMENVPIVTIVLGNISEFTETDQSVGPYQTLT